MTREELVNNLTYLIKKYVENNTMKHQLLEEISRRDFYVAKGVLHKIRKITLVFDKKDSDLIKDIVFNYC